VTPALYTPTVDSDTPRLVTNVLRADAELAGFFTSIRQVGYEMLLDGWRPKPPCLLVLPAKLDDRQMTGVPFYGLFDVTLVAYLYPQTPTTDAVTPPSAPGAVSAASGGNLGAGVYHYALTGFDGSGESPVKTLAGVAQFSPALTLSVASSTTVTYPSLSGYSGFRLWRTRANGRGFYFHSVLTSASPLTDNVADADLGEEMAPIESLGASLTARIRKVLKAGETLREAGITNANAGLTFRTVGDGRRSDWNVRFISQVATYDLTYDSRTRVSTAQR